METVADKPSKALTPSYFVGRAYVKDRVVAMPTLDFIADYVASITNVSKTQMQSKIRTAGIAFARQLFIWLSRKYTPETLVSIAKYLNRDHSTICHSIDCIDDYLTYENDRKHLILKVQSYFDLMYQRVSNKKALIVYYQDGTSRHFNSAIDAAASMNKTVGYIYDVIRGKFKNNKIKIKYKYEQ